MQHSQSVFSTIFGGKKTKVTAVALSEQKIKGQIKTIRSDQRQ